MAKDNLDSKDLALLKALKQNARASLVALARDIDLSRSATHDRILKLEEAGVIKKYTVEIDKTVLQPVRAFMTLQFSSPAAQRDLVPAIHQLPGVAAAYCLAGDIDMFVYCECETAIELSDLRDQLAEFDGVSHISTRHILASSLS